MSYTMYTPLNVWLDPASVTDVVAYIQNYLSENTIYSEEEIEELIHDYLIAHPELIGGVQSVNGKTGTVVLSASDINTQNNVTIESVLSSLASQISSIAASVATNTSNITSLTGRVTTAETDISNLKSSVTNNRYLPYDYADWGVSGYWYTTTSTTTPVSETPNTTTTEGQKCVQIPVSVGDTIILAVGTGQNSNCRAWNIITNDRLMIERSTGTKVFDSRNNPIKIEISDSNAAYVLINYNDTVYPGCYVYKDSSLDPLRDLSDGVVGNYVTVRENLKSKLVQSGSISASVVGATVNYTVGSSSTFLHLVLECQKDDIFVITGTGGSGARLWAFVDENDKILSVESANAVRTNLELVVPSNGRVIFNFNIGNNRAYELTLLHKRRMSEVEKYDINSIKYVMGKWDGYSPFEEMTGWNSTWNTADFPTYYNLFHTLAQTYSSVVGFEEIDMSTDYLADPNVTDSIPSEISGITNGKLLMYHISPLPDSFEMTNQAYKSPKILIVSGLHGGEKKSIIDCYILLKKLLENDATNRAITLLRMCDVYIAPMINVYGINENTRANYNNVNLNRDFPVLEWTASDGGNTAPLSQYETRCLVWWINRISPQLLIDHHTSSGVIGTETRRALHWGASAFRAVVSLINQNEIELTPYYRAKFSTQLADYQFNMGYAQISTDQSSGTLATYGCELGIVSITYECMMHLKWDEDGEYIWGFTDSDENTLVGIAWNGFINILMTLITKTVSWLNDGVSIKTLSGGT